MRTHIVVYTFYTIVCSIIVPTKSITMSIKIPSQFSDNNGRVGLIGYLLMGLMIASFYYQIKSSTKTIDKLEEEDGEIKERLQNIERKL